MTLPCTVLIAAPDLLGALKPRIESDGVELLAFTNTEALRALEVISTRRPQAVALEREFAATARGAALINRIKADPALSGCEIRVVSLTEEARVAATVPSTTPASVSVPLDADGTRLAPRYTMAEGLQIVIDRNPATLVDLSIGGAQVLSPTVLKPNQKVRLTLTDDQGTLRVNGSVAWATFEIPPRYRAGIEFLDAEANAIEAFALRHRA